MQPDARYTVKVDDRYEFAFDQHSVDPDWIDLGEDRFHLRDANASYHVTILDYDISSRELEVEVNGRKHRVKIENELDALIREMGFSSMVIHKAKEVKAPMPGTVLDLFVEVGQEIFEGEKLLILEAMKMENVLKAPGDGMIKEIKVVAGKAVNKNEVLIVLE